MTKRVLIIEDDESKRAQIRHVVVSSVPTVRVEEAASYQSGLKRALDEPFDMLLLDMTMPTFDLGPSENGGRVRPFAGKDLMEQLGRRNVAFRALVVTGFEILGEGESQTTLSALDGELARLFPGRYLGSIHYNPAFKEWETKLSETVTLELGK